MKLVLTLTKVILSSNHKSLEWTEKEEELVGCDFKLPNMAKSLGNFLLLWNKTTLGKRELG